jgi:helix-turn-helix protein
VKTRKRTEITIETDRLVVVSGRKVSIVSWCRECNQRVKMVTVDDAAAMAGLSSRTVYRWIEAEKIHSLETSEKFLLVCPRSLMSARGMEETGID